ncbi:MAG: hypothetical protein ACE5K3_01075 [bacterium]
MPKLGQLYIIFVPLKYDKILEGEIRLRRFLRNTSLDGSIGKADGRSLRP